MPARKDPTLMIATKRQDIPAGSGFDELNRRLEHGVDPHVDRDC